MEHFRQKLEAEYLFCSKIDPADCGRLTFGEFMERGGSDVMSDDYILGNRCDTSSFIRKVYIFHKTADAVRQFCSSFGIEEEFFRMNILLSRAYVVE